MTTIAEAHPALRGRVRETLCKAILLDDEVGKKAALDGENVLNEDPVFISTLLAAAAEAGNLSAALGLIIAGADTSPTKDVARQRLERDIQPVSHQPGVSSFGSALGETAILVTALGDTEKQRFVEAMLVRVHDTRDEAWNRQDALGAVSIVGRSMND